MMNGVLEQLAEMIQYAGTLDELRMNADDVVAAGDAELSALYRERLVGFENKVAVVAAEAAAAGRRYRP